MKRGYLLLLSIFNLTVTLGQEPLFRNEYYLNPFIINPAATGMENYRVINASYKRQWQNVQDAPGIQLLSITNRIGNHDFYNPKMFLNKSNIKTKNRIGVGACVFNDHNGPLSYQGIYLSYAYHVPFRFSRLSLGLSGSFIQHLLDQREFDPYQTGDPSISYNTEIFYFPNTSFGVVYHNHKYLIGASVNQVINVNNRFNGSAKSKNDYSLIGGYKFRDMGVFNIETSAYVSLEDYETINYDIHFKMYIFDFYWISTSYRSYRAMNFQVGIKIIRNIYAAYGFEANMGEIVNYYSGTHQLNLGVNIGLRAVQGVRTYVKNKI